MVLRRRVRGNDFPTRMDSGPLSARPRGQPGRLFYATQASKSSRVAHRGPVTTPLIARSFGQRFDQSGAMLTTSRPPVNLASRLVRLNQPQPADTSTLRSNREPSPRPEEPAHETSNAVPDVS